MPDPRRGRTSTRSAVPRDAAARGSETEDDPLPNGGRERP